MNTTVRALTLAVSLVSAAAAQQQIPLGGPILDRRGFNNNVNNRALTDPVQEVARRVAGNVYVIAGPGEHFSEGELVNLTMQVVAINGWNRLAIAFRAVPAGYQPAGRKIEGAKQ